MTEANQNKKTEELKAITIDQVEEILNLIKRNDMTITYLSHKFDPGIIYDICPETGDRRPCHDGSMVIDFKVCMVKKPNDVHVRKMALR